MVLDKRYKLSIRLESVPIYLFMIVDVSGSMYETINVNGVPIEVVSLVLGAAFRIASVLARRYTDIVEVVVLYSSQCEPDVDKPIGTCMQLGNFRRCVLRDEDCGDVYVIGREIAPEEAWRRLFQKGTIRVVTGGTVPEPAFRAVEQVADMLKIPYYNFGYMLTDGYIATSKFILPRQLMKPSQFYIYTIEKSALEQSTYIWRGNDVSSIVRNNIHDLYVLAPKHA